jgi:hypothetical protein
MRKSWLIAAVVGSAASAAQAADVQLFGIHIPQTNQYAVYARISNPASVSPLPGRESVAGISSIAIDVLNNGPATVATAVNMLPQGDTNDASAIAQKYGFWLFRPPSPTIDATGAHDILAAQFAEFAPETATQYNQYVLQGVGLNGGVKPVGGPFTTEAVWASPVLVAKGTYTGNAGTTGVGLQYAPGTGVNLLKDTDPGAGPGALSWSGPGNLEGAASTIVTSAKTFTTGTPTAGTTTVKAGLGDANLDGNVAFEDLVALAQNYDTKGKSWFQGDFDLDNQVNFNDLVLLAQNYGLPVPASGTFSASFESDMAAAFAQVPEPAALGLVGLVAAGLMGRRKRR